MMKRRSLMAAGLLLLLTGPASAEEKTPMIFRDGERVLFQGDSITDGARGRTADPNHILGHSYPFLIASRYAADHPEQNVDFVNRGLGGNRVAELTKRWKTDTIDMRPDVVSIMIGINDVLLGVRNNQPVSLDTFEFGYDQLLADTVAARPGVRLILLEPFFAIGGKQTVVQPEVWGKTVVDLQKIVARLAEKYHAPVVKLQSVFDNAAKRAPVGFWIWDGIHPTYAGHQLIADAWRETYEKFYGKAPTTRPSAGSP